MLEADLALKDRHRLADVLEARPSVPETALLEMLQRGAGAGVPFRINPSHLGGFTR
jgi:hypothetical protein